MSGSSIHASTPTDAAVLSVRGLDVRFRTRRGVEHVLRGTSLEVPRGTALGLVGESGCGKSTLLKAALGALAGNALVTGGDIACDGLDLRTADAEAIRRLRWRRVSMIPQSALNALNPVLRVSDQMVEAVQAHSDLDGAAARRKVAAMAARVGIDPRRIDDYPHQFSGGMRQRAVIAMALILEPVLVLADEPTTSLDVIVQDQIFRLIGAMRRELGFALLLVTHDLALVIENCERIAVMYAGAIVEEGPTAAIAAAPFHPYTLGLRNSMPTLGGEREPVSIPGSPPDPLLSGGGCRFAPRCPFVLPVCRNSEPAAVSVGDGHRVACHRTGDAALLRRQAADLETWVAKAGTDA